MWRFASCSLFLPSLTHTASSQKMLSCHFMDWLNVRLRSSFFSDRRTLSVCLKFWLKSVFSEFCKDEVWMPTLEKNFRRWAKGIERIYIISKWLIQIFFCASRVFSLSRIDFKIYVLIYMCFFVDNFYRNGMLVSILYMLCMWSSQRL